MITLTDYLRNNRNLILQKNILNIPNTSHIGNIQDNSIYKEEGKKLKHEVDIMKRYINHLQKELIELNKEHYELLDETKQLITYDNLLEKENEYLLKELKKNKSYRFNRCLSY